MVVLKKPVLFTFLLQIAPSGVGSSFLFGTELPTGPSGVRSPFTFLECDAQGGENTFEEAEASLAFLLGQMPFYSVKVHFILPVVLGRFDRIDSFPPHTRHFSLLLPPSFPLPPPPPTSLLSQFPNWIVSTTWPRNMEVQSMYPELTSTYTFPTGTKVEVPCFAPNTNIEIQRTECPSSFVNPMDINHAKPCVNVCIKLHGTLSKVSIDPPSPLPLFLLTYLRTSQHPVHMHNHGRSPVQWQFTQTRSIRGCGLRIMLLGWLACCSTFISW